MFGYIVANINKLSDEEKIQYNACYCGLCKTLGERHGPISRITLTYDMTFLVLLLSALYNRSNEIQTEKCTIHPLKSHKYWQNEFTDYAADMNVALAYYNFIDDWTDDKKVISLMEAKLFKSEYNYIEQLYPGKCSIISRCLMDLSDIEKSGEMNPDIPANSFGRLMGEIFAFKKDEYSESLREFGKSLGRFIYIMDACFDLKTDIKKEHYNPLVATSSENFREILNLLMADCTEKFNLLPINQNKGLIENILYSGVWTRYEAKERKETKKI